MKQLTTKVKQNFYKEVGLAILLFLLPFGIQTHLWFSDEKLTRLVLFGFHFTPEYDSDRSAIWGIVLIFLPLSCTLMCYFISKFYWRIMLLPLIWWLTFELFGDFLWQLQEIGDGWRLPAVGISSLTTIIIVLLDSSYIKSLLHRKNLVLLRQHTSPFLLIFVILCLGPSYLLIPYDTYELLLFEFKLYATEVIGIRNILWISALKATLLLISILWFFYEKKWWRYALLSPILITFYQIQNIYNEKVEFLDENEIWKSLPFLAMVALLLIALSKNAKEQYLFQSIYQKTRTGIENRLTQQHKKKQQQIEVVKEQLASLKNQQADTELQELLELKQRLEKELGKR